MKQNTITIPSGARSLTWEQVENKLIITFESEYVEGKWYYVPNYNKAFRCTKDIKKIGTLERDGIYEISFKRLNDFANVTEATTAQIEATLGKVCDAKGFKLKCKVNRDPVMPDSGTYIISILNPEIYSYSGDRNLFFFYGWGIFNNQTNEWAEIIQPKVTLTKEQMGAVEKWSLNNPIHVKAGFMGAFTNEFQEE